MAWQGKWAELQVCAPLYVVQSRDTKACAYCVNAYCGSRLHGCCLRPVSTASILLHVLFNMPAEPICTLLGRLALVYKLGR